ncbi:MAG: 1,4-beta-xylanase [Acidobacteria bacterium]|nr:1,4-beta-xylanase [Acidobacteriota bacterium]
MRNLFRVSLLLVLAAASLLAKKPWSEEKAKKWYAKSAWLVGANYIPASAINQLEMWQGDTFNPGQIDQEFGWAQAIGMNTMRIYLHHLLWQEDKKGLLRRMDTLLELAEKHRIKPIFVLFDSCWDPYPQVGRQRAPQKGVHNSGWLQSPGSVTLQKVSDTPKLEAYVRGVVGAFHRDRRILAWDIWNEPDNWNDSSYKKVEPLDKLKQVERLLPQAFAWARDERPIQPLTSGVWKGDWSSDDKLTSIERIQLAQSDVISFHNYDAPAKLKARIDSLRRFNRPILCTEYMARGNGSTFEGSLPIGKAEGVAMINWGLVQGKTQTHLPWDSWKQPYTNREPSVWFHEIFRPDGSPYKPEEVEFIRKTTAR